MSRARRRFIRVKRYGKNYTVENHRGRVFYRTQKLWKAKRRCRKILAYMREQTKPVPRQGDGKKLHIRRRGSGYTVVDSRGRVYGHEGNYTDAWRLWRRTLVGLSREAGRRVA